MYNLQHDPWNRRTAVMVLCGLGAMRAPVATEAVQPPPDEPVAVLRANQAVFADVVRTLAPSLVRIETVGGSQPPEQQRSASPDNPNPPDSQQPSPFRDTPGSSFFVADGPTTGIIYSPDGYIITSSFNFVREPELISVVLSDGRRLPASLIARDQVLKVALLKIEAKALPVPAWTTVDRITVGQWAVALGLGFGGKTPAVSVGIISALRRMQGHAIQTDAKLSPSNYGGPLADVRGRIMGLCVPMAQRPGELAGTEMYDSGVGFALPKAQIDGIVARLKTGTNVYRGWLGTQVDPHVPDTVLILNLADPSPLREAGAKPGDRITAVDGKPIHHYGQFISALALLPAGRTTRIGLERNDKTFEVTIQMARANELGPLPPLPPPFDPSNPHAPDPDK